MNESAAPHIREWMAKARVRSMNHGHPLLLCLVCERLVPKRERDLRRPGTQLFCGHLVCARCWTDHLLVVSGAV